MNKNFYNYQDCEKIARRIWRGKFPRMNTLKFADSIEFGIDYLRDYVMIGPKWEQITDTLEMKYEKTDVNVGRFYVRRIAE